MVSPWTGLSWLFYTTSGDGGQWGRLQGRAHKSIPREWGTYPINLLNFLLFMKSIINFRPNFLKMDAYRNSEIFPAARTRTMSHRMMSPKARGWILAAPVSWRGSFEELG